MKDVKVGNITVGEKPVWILGPCAIESRDQMQSEAVKLKNLGATMLRGGAFKPRTNPSSFQGLGMTGVKYLAEAGKMTGLPVVTEVLSERDLEAMMPFVDVFQIGSRNMYNYALLREVGRTGKPVILKRGFSATLEEWIGASEYIAQEGNENIIYCERGIRTFGSDTRNTLDIAGAVLLRMKTGRPVICDPSHGTGKRALIRPMAFAALAAGLDGLMIEVHETPDRAISDAAQTISVEHMAEIIKDGKKFENCI